MVNTSTLSSNKSSSAARQDELDLFKSSAPLGFAGGDANLTRYVRNGPTSATDPTGLAIKRHVAIVVSEASNTAENRKRIDEILDLTQEILKRLNVELTSDYAIMPNVMTEKIRWAFDPKHNLTRAVAIEGRTTCEYLCRWWPTFKFTGKSAKRLTQTDIVYIFFSQGNTGSWSYMPGNNKVRPGACTSLEEQKHQDPEVTARIMAHEILAHAILRYEHPVGGGVQELPGHERGITMTGWGLPRRTEEHEKVSPEVRDKILEMDKSGKGSIAPEWVLPKE